jgi:hypothetical protein
LGENQWSEDLTVKYKVTIPFQDDMGSIAPFIAKSTTLLSAREDALWEFNSMRRHDGLPERKRLPNGTKFEPVYE